MIRIKLYISNYLLAMLFVWLLECSAYVNFQVEFLLQSWESRHERLVVALISSSFILNLDSESGWRQVAFDIHFA